MDTESKKSFLREILKKKRKKLRAERQEIVDEQEQLRARKTLLSQRYDQLFDSMMLAIKAEDEESERLLRAQRKELADEIERISGLEKTNTEKLDLYGKVMKNDKDGRTNVWSCLGAWVASIGTIGFGAWGISKSYHAFEEGTLVDKTTRSIAERFNPASLFRMFQKK